MIAPAGIYWIEFNTVFDVVVYAERILKWVHVKASDDFSSESKHCVSLNSFRMFLSIG